MSHFVSKSCLDEYCIVCGIQASHKIGEEIPDDDPLMYRHNLTAYVCCRHFKQIFGNAASCVITKCEINNCNKYADHAEAWFSSYRYWCEEHTPWSGHYENCGEVCRNILGKICK